MRPRSFIDPALPDIPIDAVIVFTALQLAVAVSYAARNAGYGTPVPVGRAGGFGAQEAANVSR